MTILISPYSNRLPNGKPSPKNWPQQNWTDLIEQIKKEFHYVHIIQLGIKGEPQIKKTDILLPDLPLERIETLIKDSSFFISVDNFFPHFVSHYENKSGIVIFGPSNPKYFGYLKNKNLYKSDKLFRKNQFWYWDPCDDCNLNNFPTVEEVMVEVRKYLNK